MHHSFDHLDGAAEQRERHGDAERLSGFEVQEHFNLRALLHKQVARLFAFENAGGVDSGLLVRVCETAAIAEQTTDREKRAELRI